MINVNLLKQLLAFLVLLVWDVVNNNIHAQVTHFIPYSDSHIQYEGRVKMIGTDAAELYWSGTSARIRFKGTCIKALMKDENGNNYYYVIIDNDSIYKMPVDSIKHLYTLAENLPKGRHTIELFRITQINKEYKRGYTKLYGFQLGDNGKLLNPPSSKKRKIEFYGNSITCGHAVEDNTGGDSGASIYENNYLSYAAVTARHFNAQYSCIAKSGIGVMVSYAPLIMPEMYDRLNPIDSLSIWDFSKYIPNVVVINLLQNDYGIVNRLDFAEYKRRFGTTAPDDEFIIKSYQAFLQSIRGKYPNSHIICCLGSMSATKEGSKWPGYIDKAVDNLHDKRIYSHFFPYKNTPGHPRVPEQKIMANSLISFINKNIHW